MRSSVALKRIAVGLVTVYLALTVAFVLTRITGDPVRQLLGVNATQEQVDLKRAELGLDQPVIQQYLTYLADVVRGDFGESLRYGTSNLGLIVERLPASLQLAFAAIVIGVVVGLTLGMLSALYRDTAVDAFVSVLALVGQSVPSFFVGIVLISIFAVNLGWVPSAGNNGFSSLVLPAIALSLLPLAQVARISRSSAVEVLEQDYIRAARARGFGIVRVVLHHVLRSVGLPVLTVLGLQIGALVSSAVTVEYVFNWPGIGSLTADAVTNRDFSLIQSLVVLGAVTFVVVNLAVDLLYRVIDPRVRAS